MVHDDDDVSGHNQKKTACGVVARALWPLSSVRLLYCYTANIDKFNTPELDFNEIRQHLYATHAHHSMPLTNTTVEVQADDA